MNDPIRISAKNLGALALPSVCPRCFWLKLKSNHRLPFQIFPGIFSSIDAYTKRVVHAYFDEHGAPPEWLNPLGAIVGYREPPHFSKFNMLNEDHGVLLTGAADGILVRDDSSFVIVDYKTAKFTGAQDDLLPMYAVLLNAYASIGEHCGFAPVTGLALIYMEPMTTRGRLDRQCRGYGFDMGFSAHILEIDLNPKMLDPLLIRLRELFESPSPPPSQPGCKDCELTEWLMGLFQARRMRVRRRIGDAAPSGFGVRAVSRPPAEDDRSDAAESCWLPADKPSERRRRVVLHAQRPCSGCNPPA